MATLEFVGLFFAGVSVVTRAGLGTKLGPGNHRADCRRGGGGGGVIAVVDGGGGGRK